MKEIDLVERVVYEGSKVDKGSGVIHDVAILKSTSPSHNRVYPDTTLQAAIPLIEGTSVFLDHPKKRDLGEDRSVRDLAGKLAGVHFVEGRGLVGDLRVMPNQPWILDVAEKMPEIMGHSINGKGTTKSGSSGKEVVESIRLIRSVDLVTAPGTVTSLFESKETDTEGGEEKVDWTEVTMESLLENKADLVETIRKEATDTSDADKKAAELQEQVKTLKKEKDDLETKEALREKAIQVEKLIVESKLPKEAVTDTFRKQLMESEDEKGMKALIEDRKGLVEGAKKPKSTGRDDLKESAKIEDEELVAIVTG